MSCGSCMISKRTTGFSYQEAAGWCMERKSTRTGNLIYMLVKQNTFHYWIGAAKLKMQRRQKKKVSFPFALSHVRRMFVWCSIKVLDQKAFNVRWGAVSTAVAVGFLWWLGECGETGSLLVTVFHLWPEAVPALGDKVMVMAQPEEEKLWSDLIVACQDLRKPKRKMERDCFKRPGVTG